MRVPEQPAARSSDSHSFERKGLLLAAVVLCILFAAVAASAGYVPEMAVLLLLAGAVYVAAVYLVLEAERRSENLERSGPRPIWAPGPLFIIAVALAIRVIAFSMFPPTTDDLFRYRWEGKLTAEGGNPYLTRPAEMTSQADSVFDRVPAKDFRSGYGPLIAWVYGGTYLAASAITSDPLAQVFWFKAPAALFDLGVIGALAALLSALRLPPERLLIYAWSPLPVFELWANGHNDSAAVSFVLLALWAAARRKPVVAYLTFGAAVAAKLWPVLGAAALVRGVRSYRWAPLSVAVFAVAAWRFRGNVVENFQFMTGFLAGWRNNDSLFSLVYLAAGQDAYRAKYLGWSVAILAAVALALYYREAAKAVLGTVVALLLISANVHPWYLTWFLPLLAVYPSAPLLLWTALMPLASGVWIGWSVLGVWEGSTELRWWIYAPVFTMAAVSWFVGRRAPRT